MLKPFLKVSGRTHEVQVIWSNLAMVNLMMVSEWSFYQVAVGKVIMVRVCQVLEWSSSSF
jgi:hypothetical protein